ncbi:hypothetical protein [Flavobacterium sp. JP2137]|uniref:hypothetical protein n=1 Tax=Flavobacterium sp. JP2137 TaxID=3414510 RepID=UPI003D30077E
MAVIRIVRSSEGVNRLRNYRVFIDGQKVGTVANGETKEFVATAAKHSIQTKIDWCSSPIIYIDGDDSSVHNFKVSSFAYKNKSWKLLTFLMFAVLIVDLILSKAFDFYYSILLFFPLAAYLLYYLIMGKAKYLNLTAIR